MSFGQTIRRKRKALALTLEDLAERSGLTPNFVGSVENGQRDPSLSTVLALAKGLRTPVAELLGGVRDVGPEALEAAHLFEGAAPDVQVAVLGLLRAVSRRRR